LKPDEFIQSTSKKPYLKFTYCTVPFEYKQDGKTGIELIYTNGKIENVTGYVFKEIQSQAIFNRDKKIKKVIVSLNSL
jgi:hypothetical protein